MMPSMLVKACGFSILGQIFGRFSCGTFMRSMMSISSCKSCSFWAKDTQMYSTGGSNCKRNSASSMSFAVKAAQSISTSGTFTPFRAFNFPPRTTLTLSSVSETFSTTLTFMSPSSISRSMPGWAARTRAFCSTVAFMVMRPGLMWSLSSLQMPNSRTSPSTSGTGSPASSATRNFGPCRSPRHSICLPISLAYLRIRGYTRSKSPPRRWEQFSRKMSVPASIIFGIISSLHEDGPRLATTFVRRLLSSISWGLLPSSTK
mmetsp:Transcript_80164/g.245040  ORF Transcript_80164/g.245040 Transcript_80164/m.245040 type:complete len:260 (-) Transcript_80164:148-927(-)